MLGLIFKRSGNGKRLGSILKFRLHVGIASMLLGGIVFSSVAFAQQEDAELLHKQEKQEQIAKFRERGVMGPLQAELIELMNKHYASPQEKLSVISGWHKLKGSGLKEELAAKSAVHDDFKAEVREKRLEMIRQKAASGDIGPKVYSDGIRLTDASFWRG